MNNKILAAPLVSAKLGKQAASGADERGSSFEQSERSNTFDNAMRRAADREPRADRGEPKPKGNRGDHDRRADSAAASTATKRSTSTTHDDQVDTAEETATIDASSAGAAAAEPTVLPNVIEVPLAPLATMPLSLDQIEQILAQSGQDLADSTAQQTELVEAPVATEEMATISTSTLSAHDQSVAGSVLALRTLEATPGNTVASQTLQPSAELVGNGSLPTAQPEAKVDTNYRDASVMPAAVLTNASALVQAQVTLDEQSVARDGEQTVDELVLPEAPALSASTQNADSGAAVEKSGDPSVSTAQLAPTTAPATSGIVSLSSADSGTSSIDPSGVTPSLETSSASHAEAAELAALDEDGSADSVMRQVKRAIGSIRNAGGGDHEFKIRLVPRELGSVTIGIQTSEAGIAIGLVTETSAASDRLNEQRQQLMDELAESGLDSSNVDISHEGQDQNYFGGGTDSDGAESHSAGSSDSASSSAADALANRQSTGVNRARTPGRVDVAL